MQFGGSQTRLAANTEGHPSTCYPDCTQNGALTVANFGCFQTAFVLGCP